MNQKVFDAIYKDGVLRPLSPLPFVEGEKVRFFLEEKGLREHSDKALLQQLVMAAEATVPCIPGPIEAYEAAEQLQKFLLRAKEEGV